MNFRMMKSWARRVGNLVDKASANPPTPPKCPGSPIQLPGHPPPSWRDRGIELKACHDSQVMLEAAAANVTR
jgi:hypothetical protein